MVSSNDQSILTHKCRFIQYMPSGITSIDFTPSSSKIKYLACARENGNIELWNPKGQSWFLEKTIYGSSETLFESILFASGNKCPRLFAASLDGRILQYDIETLTLVQYQDSNGGAIWSMCLNEDHSLLAIGCEDGYIRIYDISQPDSIEFLRVCERHDGRVLSLSWYQDVIVAGSDHSSLRKYDSKSGKCVSRMTVDTLNKEDTIVWDCKILSLDVMVSGDSLGKVIFWDLKTCTAFKSFKCHGADVLCLDASSAGDVVFSSGVDRKVVQYKLASHSKWVTSGEKRYHSHDVRAIKWIQERPFETLVTGGMDTILIMSSPVNEFPHIKQYRMPFFPHEPRVSMAKSSRLIMHQFDTELKIWKLGDAIVSGQVLELLQDKQKLENPMFQFLFDLKFNLSSNIRTSAISESGEWIAFSNNQGLRLYKLENSVVSRQGKSLANALPNAHKLAFTPDSSRLIIAGCDCRIYVLSLSEEFSIIETLDLPDACLVTRMNISLDGQWLAVADYNHKVFIYNLDSYRLSNQLSAFDHCISSLTFHPYSPTLVITTIGNLFYLYDVEGGCYTDWTREYSHRLPDRFVSRRDVIMGCAFDLKRQNVLTLWGSDYFCKVDLEKPMGPKNASIVNSKRKKQDELRLAQVQEQEKNVICLDGDEQFNSKFSQTFTMDHRYQPLLFLDYMGDELVVVERPALSVVQALPPGYYKHYYGT